MCKTFSFTLFYDTLWILLLLKQGIVAVQANFCSKVFDFDNTV